MRISDEECREVARNLREIEERTLLDVTDGELLDLLAEAVGLDGYEGEHLEGGLLYCLADLIDRPTCFDTEDKDSDFFTCSACGFYDRKIAVNPFTLSLRYVKPSYRYCPNCGAEVIPHAERRD